MTETEANALLLTAKRADEAIRLRMVTEIKDASAVITARYADEIARSKEALHLASVAVRDAKDSRPDHPWTGRRVFKMELAPGSYGWERNPKRLRVEGVVETVRSSTDFPTNTASYNQPSIGDPLVRLLKKDGTPGTRFSRMYGEYHGWELDEVAQ